MNLRVKLQSDRDAVSAHEPAAGFQQLGEFKLPPNFRGRSGVLVQLWWLVQATLFRASPQVLCGFRRWLLRLFGARIGKGVVVRPTATFTYPWKITLGDNAWIGDDVVIYSLGPITIGSDAVISQRSYLCAGTHDFSNRGFDILSASARSSVYKDLPEMMVSAGSPARPRHPRF
jgi:putative colanic acid biosynthesis acetyltransferase WcaF